MPARYSRPCGRKTQAVALTAPIVGVITQLSHTNADRFPERWSKTRQPRTGGYGEAAVRVSHGHCEGAESGAALGRRSQRRTGGHQDVSRCDPHDVGCVSCCQPEAVAQKYYVGLPRGQ